MAQTENSTQAAAVDVTEEARGEESVRQGRTEREHTGCAARNPSRAAGRGDKRSEKPWRTRAMKSLCRKTG